MFKAMRSGLLILVIAFLASGCGGNVGDKFVKQQIAFFNSSAEELEKVTDKASFERAQTAVAALAEQNRKPTEEFAALSEETRKAAMDANKADYDKAFNRMGAAKKKAHKAAFGSPGSAPAP